MNRTSNKKRLNNQRGITLVEMIIAAVLGILVVAVLINLLGKSSTFIRRMRVRQSVSTDSRVAMDIILERLRSGKARTLRLSVQPTTTVVPSPYTRVDFVLNGPLPSGATAYAIYLSNGNIYTQEYIPGLTPAPRVAASNVTILGFTGSTNDPAMVSVSLKMDAPWDSTGDPSHMTSIFLANQTVRMVETQ